MTPILVFLFLLAVTLIYDKFSKHSSVDIRLERWIVERDLRDE